MAPPFHHAALHARPGLSVTPNPNLTLPKPKHKRKGTLAADTTHYLCDTDRITMNLLDFDQYLDSTQPLVKIYNMCRQIVSKSVYKQTNRQTERQTCFKIRVPQIKNIRKMRLTHITK